MVILIKKLSKNVILGGDIFFFSTSYSKVVVKICCTFNIEKFVNHENFVTFRFLYLHYRTGTNSKYFQNSISESAISSVTQKSTT